MGICERDYRLRACKNYYAISKKDDCIKQLYEQWLCANREKLSLYYDPKDNDPSVPIEKNPEFRSLKNAIISTPMGIDFTQFVQQSSTNVGALFSQLAHQISNSVDKRLDVLHSRMPLSDSKEREKIEEKKRALGQKTGGASEKEEEEIYDSHSVEAILTGLDMLLKELERRRAEEKQQKFLALSDIDQAYDEFLDGEDDEYDKDYDSDYDEDEDDGFVISM